MSHVAVMRHTVRHLMPEVFRLVAERGLILDGDLLHPDRITNDLGILRQAMLEHATSEPDQYTDDEGRVIGLSIKDQTRAAAITHQISRTGLELAGRLKTGPQVAVNVGTQQQDTGPEMMRVVQSELEAAGQSALLERIAVRLAGGDPDAIEATATEVEKIERD